MLFFDIAVGVILLHIHVSDQQVFGAVDEADILDFLPELVVLGLHARPAALVARTAQQFTANVRLEADNRHVDAKSILDILSLAARKGTTLTVRGKGDDAENCLKSIARLARVQFQEESA